MSKHMPQSQGLSESSVACSRCQADENNWQFRLASCKLPLVAAYLPLQSQSGQQGSEYDLAPAQRAHLQDASGSTGRQTTLKSDWTPIGWREHGPELVVERKFQAHLGHKPQHIRSISPIQCLHTSTTHMKTHAYHVSHWPAVLSVLHQCESASMTDKTLRQVTFGESGKPHTRKPSR